MKIYIKLSERSFRCFNNETARPVDYDGCLPSGNHDGKNFCYTRAHPNGSAIRGQWGYCDQNCRQRENSSVFNLASKEHDAMWSEDIFMLVETGSSGHCHTYNPTTSSLADEGFYAMLGTCNTTSSLNYRHRH